MSCLGPRTRQKSARVLHKTSQDKNESRTLLGGWRNCYFQCERQTRDRENAAAAASITTSHVTTLDAILSQHVRFLFTDSSRDVHPFPARTRPPPRQRPRPLLRAHARDFWKPYFLNRLYFEDFEGFEKKKTTKRKANIMLNKKEDPTPDTATRADETAGRV